jgi:hypothetical protein
LAAKVSDRPMSNDRERARPDPDEDTAAVKRLVALMPQLGIELIDATALSQIFGLDCGSRAELSRLRAENAVIAVRWKGRWRYPSFQFDEAGRVIARVTALLREIRPDLSHWTLLGWLVHEQPLLSGARPLEALSGSDAEWAWICAAARVRFDDEVGLD